MAQKINPKGSFTPITSNTRSVMNITLIASLLLHFFILIGLRETFPVDWVKQPLKTFHVELFRLPVDSLDDEKEKEVELEKKLSEKKTLPRIIEDTISLDTKDKKYMPYAKSIKAKLMQHWEYPNEAWENLIEGDVLILFSLDRQGKLKRFNILNSSSHDILDRETARTIRTSAPFPPFPGSVTVTKLNIKANFTYRLTANNTEKMH